MIIHGWEINAASPPLITVDEGTSRSCRPPYSAEHIFTQKGQVLRAPGVAESSIHLLVGTLRAEIPTAISWAQRTSPGPIIKGLTERWAKGVPMLFQTAYKASQQWEWVYHCLTKAHLEDLRVRLHPRILNPENQIDLLFNPTVNTSCCVDAIGLKLKPAPSARKVECNCAARYWHTPQVVVRNKYPKLYLVGMVSAQWSMWLIIFDLAYWRVKHGLVNFTV